MKMKKFDFFEPEEIGATLAILRDYAGQAKILAGGTDLVPQMKRGIAAPQALISLSRNAGLKQMKESALGLRIGSMVSLRTLEKSPLLARKVPALTQAVRHVAVASIRSMATFGGNLCLDTKCIYRDLSQKGKGLLEPCLKGGGGRCYVARGGKTCHASLAADTVPVLIALEAKARILSANGERMIPVESLYTGDGISPLALAQDELVAEILLPAVERRGDSSYLRFSLRKALDFPLVSIAVYMEKREGVCREVRLVLGAVAPRPLRLDGVERALEGEKGTEDLFRQCAEKAPEEALQISRCASINIFTRGIITRLTYQGLQEAWQGRNLS